METAAPSAALKSLDDVSRYVFGGHATFTLVSKLTGERKTFRVESAGEEKPGCFFVRLLVGPENESAYRYLGFVHPAGLANPSGFALTLNKDRWAAEAGEGFNWMLRHIAKPDGGKFFTQSEFWHSGRCARCGRLLTDPESIAHGLGPKCAER